MTKIVKNDQSDQNDQYKFLKIEADCENEQILKKVTKKR